MNKATISIWDRQFSLPIEYDVFPGESVTQLQKQAVESFIREENITSNKDISKYIIQHDGKQTGNKIDNIFKYVMPKYLYVPLNPEDRIIAIICDYRFDEEHGIALVYKNEVLKEIGPQDIVL